MKLYEYYHFKLLILIYDINYIRFHNIIILSILLHFTLIPCGN